MCAGESGACGVRGVGGESRRIERARVGVRSIRGRSRDTRTVRITGARVLGHSDDSKESVPPKDASHQGGSQIEVRADNSLTCFEFHKSENAVLTGDWPDFTL